MRKRLYKIFFLLLAVIFAVLPLGGCSMGKRAETAEELIPEALGDPEGLWLYYGAYRSRTDGSESQPLFGSVTIGETEYGYDTFFVRDYIYSTDSHTALYLLEIEGYGYCLYWFDYAQKAGKYICDASGERVAFTASDGYTYAQFGEAGYLLDGNGNLVCDTIDGYIQNGILYSVAQERSGDETLYCVEWYYNGYHKAYFPNVERYSIDVDVCGDYLYLSANGVPKYAVEKNTGEVTVFTAFDIIPNTNKYVEERRHVEEKFCYNGAIYVFSVVYRIIDYGDETHEEKDEWYWYLHKVAGNKVTCECEFGEVRHGVNMGVYDGKFYFEARTIGNLYQKYYSYDPATGKLKKITKSSYHGGNIPTDTTATEKSANRRIQVNGYEFYVTSVPYGYSGFMNAPKGYCYYLNRKHGDSVEVMQYSFKSRCFYDDICGF